MTTNGTGLTEDGITLSAVDSSDDDISDDVSLVSLTGSKSVWEATIRPPEEESTVTFVVDTDAFDEGNTETSQDIRVSTAFPDDDAEDTTQLFAITARL